MKIDLTALLNKRIPAVDFDFLIDPTEIDECAELPFDISIDGKIHVYGKITDNDGYMTLDAVVSADYNTVCDRCLAPLHDSITLPFRRIVVVSKSDDTGTDEDDLLYVSEGGIDFAREVIEELSLELPVYHLCEEDCPGLCSVCGKRLDGSCRCENEKEIDPRMETFKKLLDKMKE